MIYFLMIKLSIIIKLQKWCFMFIIIFILKNIKVIYNKK